jgi:hypothetical protein
MPVKEQFIISYLTLEVWQSAILFGPLFGLASVTTLYLASMVQWWNAIFRVSRVRFPEAQRRFFSLPDPASPYFTHRVVR